MKEQPNGLKLLNWGDRQRPATSDRTLTALTPVTSYVGVFSIICPQFYLMTVLVGFSD